MSDELPTLSPEQFLTWITPSDAIEASAGAYDSEKRRALAERLRGGVLLAVAETFEQSGHKAKLYALPPDLWRVWDYRHDHTFWRIGDTTFPNAEYDPYGLESSYRAFGVRLDPAGLPGASAGKPAIAASVPIIATPAPHAGGRPANVYWEAVLIEMIRQYADGELIPNRQADVERAMLDWLSVQGHDASERSVRTRAKMVWNAIRQKGQ